VSGARVRLEAVDLAGLDPAAAGKAHSICAAGAPVELPADASADLHAEFTAALTRVQPQLRTRAQFLTQDPDEAEDLVQNVCERALRSRDRFQAGTNLHAWLACIMRNLFVDGYRTRRCHVTLTDQQVPRYEPPPPSPIETLSAIDVRAAMASLRAEDRTILDLALFQGRSYQEIALTLGLRCNTTGTRIHRARNRLKRALQVMHDARS
jgi:RNA polymerase sigma-70 factor (ECF subfamily)